MEPNPYAPPAALAQEPLLPAPGEMRLASSGQRFVNLLIDYVASVATGGLVGLALGTLIVFGVVDGSIMHNGGSTLLGIVSVVGYYVVLEASTGRTLGKLVTGTKVVAADGRRARFGQIVGRTFARFIPFEPFSFLNSPTGWHDKMSGTRVIRTRP